MFGFLRERRAKGIVAQVMPTVVEGVQTLAPVERAACFAIAHALLRKASEEWGREVIAKPATLRSDTAASIVCAMADSHAKVLREGVEAHENRGSGDLTYSQALRTARAFEATIAIIGRRFAPEGEGVQAPRAWKLLWGARGHAAEAADILLRYRKVAGVDALPRPKGQKTHVTRVQLTELAETLPPFFVQKAAAKPKAKASPRPATPNASMLASAAKAKRASTMPKGDPGKAKR